MDQARGLSVPTRGKVIGWSAPKGHRTPETIHAELDKNAKKEALSLFSR